LYVLPVNQLSYPLTSVAVATLSRLNDDPEKFRNYYLKAISILAFIGMLLSAILTLVGKDVILLLLGPQWDQAGKIFTLFGPGIGIMLIYGTNGWLHLSLGRADRWFRWGIISFITTALFFVIGLPFGAEGIAVAYVATFYVLILPCLLYAGHPINLKTGAIFSTLWRFFVSAIGTFLLCWLITCSIEFSAGIYDSFNIILRIFVSTLLSTLFYFTLLSIFYGGIKPVWQLFSAFLELLPRRTRKSQ
jgi:PST family polysaccharide transporter